MAAEQDEEARLRQVVSALESEVLFVIPQIPHKLSNTDIRGLVFDDLVATMRVCDTDAVTVETLLEQAASIIQEAMYLAQWDLQAGKPNPRAADLEEFRRLVSTFSDTARHLVQPMFSPARWPVSNERGWRC